MAELANQEDVFNEVLRISFEALMKSERLGLSGLDNAVARVFPAAPFQKCVIHLERSVLGRIKPADKKAVAEYLREVFVTDKKDDSLEKGWNRWEDFVYTWKKQYPSHRNYQDKSSYSAHLTFLKYHQKIRSLIYSTNWIERLNRDYKQTLRMRGVMPDSYPNSSLITQ